MTNPTPRPLASSPCQAPPGYWDEEECAPSAVALRLHALKTHQVEAVRAFCAALGVHFAEERHGQGPVHHAGCAGGVVLEIYPLPDGGAADHSTRLGFVVSDLRRVLDAVQAGGAALVSAPQQTPWGHRAVVRDPDGRAVELYQQEG